MHLSLLFVACGQVRPAYYRRWKLKSKWSVRFTPWRNASSGKGFPLTPLSKLNRNCLRPVLDETAWPWRSNLTRIGIAFRHEPCAVGVNKKCAKRLWSSSNHIGITALRASTPPPPVPPLQSWMIELWAPQDIPPQLWRGGVGCGDTGREVLWF